jgi:23S rRNA A2030 N6-methylase RlmJ
MSEYLVTCVTKPDRFSTHEHITHIGNTADKWKITRESAITQIDAKQAGFYTVDSGTGRRAYVGVVREAGKAPYLRTHADGTWNDNLLAQAECNGSCKLIG